MVENSHFAPTQWVHVLTSPRVTSINCSMGEKAAAEYHGIDKSFQKRNGSLTSRHDAVNC